MPIFSNDELLQLNKSGWIPGPYEDEEAFAKRVQYGLHLTENLPEELQTILGRTGALNQAEIVEPSLNKLRDLYDCAPKWVSLFFSNDKLPFWHGGCAWIFQMTEQSPTSALIQLRKNFYRSQRYLGFYEREELLTHELVHVGRMMFQEPKFEELIAYRTSRSRFRQWWGSIVQSSGESALFLLTLFVLMIFDLFLLGSGRSDAYSYALWLKTIPILMLVAAGIRLQQRHRTFNQCIARLREYNTEYAEAIAYRLTDEEICLFAKLSLQEIKDYAIQQAEKELRWRVIVSAYSN